MKRTRRSLAQKMKTSRVAAMQQMRTNIAFLCDKIECDFLKREEYHGNGSDFPELINHLLEFSFVMASLLEVGDAAAKEEMTNTKNNDDSSSSTSPAIVYYYEPLSLPPPSRIIRSIECQILTEDINAAPSGAMLRRDVIDGFIRNFSAVRVDWSRHIENIMRNARALAMIEDDDAPFTSPLFRDNLHAFCERWVGRCMNMYDSNNNGLTRIIPDTDQFGERPFRAALAALKQSQGDKDAEEATYTPEDHEMPPEERAALRALMPVIESDDYDGFFASLAVLTTHERNRRNKRLMRRGVVGSSGGSGGGSSSLSAP
jgi:hypothetical protein